MMRIIEKSTAFKRDYKREAKGKFRKSLDKDLVEILTLLVDDQPLSAKQRDHELVGNWGGFGECHIKPDLLLIYDISAVKILRLARMGYS